LPSKGGGGAFDVSETHNTCSIIKQSKSLTKVDLSWNDLGAIKTVAIAEAITQSKSLLVAVDLSYNQIGDVGAIAFAEAIKQSTSLTVVDLSS